MLNNINSKFILWELFSLITEKRKLELVKYNKTLQVKLDISLLYYKAFKEEFIIYETKTKGKIYNASYAKKLIYEGEYYNGKKNGIGKEYYMNGSLKFEGEYLNGKKNGKGKEYNDKGELMYEGEYLNGKRNGKGKEYNEEGILIYEGEFLNDKRNGKGKEFNDEGELRFEGEFLNGKNWNGEGVEYNIDEYEEYDY